MTKAQSGQKLTAEEQHAVNEWSKAMAGQALSAASKDAPPEIQRLVAKKQNGERLSPEEQKTLEDWARSKAAAAVQNAVGKLNSLGRHGGGVPADVEAIVQKAAAGQQLTPEEKARVRAWGRSSKAALASPKALGLCPGAQASASATISSAAPRRDAYLVQVKGAINTYGARLGQNREKIDAMLQQARHDEDVSSLGAVFLTMGAGSAAVYACAQGALRLPDDALAANNLGAALKAMKDLPRALQALLYAHTLKPDLPVAGTNLAWVYYDLGDSDKARALFDEVLAVTPHFAGAEEGLGLLSECAGDHKAAAKHLRLSMDGNYSSTCAVALEQADAAAKDGGDTDNGAGATGESESGGAAPSGFELPAPPIGETPAQAAAAVKALASMFQDAFTQEKAGVDRLIAMKDEFERAHHAGSQAVVEGGALSEPFSYDKERFQLNDLRRTFITGRATKANRHFLDQFSTLSQQISQQLAGLARECGRDEYQCCLRRKEIAQTVFPALLNAWGPCWSELKPALEGYYVASSPVVARVVDPVQNGYYNEMRRVAILHEYQAALNILMQWSALVAGLWEGKCVPPPPPAPRTKKAKVGDTDPDCPFKHPIALKLIIAEVTLDCEQKKFKVEFGELVMVSLERDFKHGRTTVFVGAGISTETIPFSPFAVEGKTGFFMTTEGDSVKDAGLMTTASETAFWTKSEIESRWGILEGPDLGLEHSVALAGFAPPE